MLKLISVKALNRQVVLNVLFTCTIVYLLLLQLVFKTRTAYIDSNKIYQNYKGILIAKTEFQKKVDLYRERMDTLSGRVKLDIMKIEKFRSNKAIAQQYVDSVKYHKKQLSDYQQSMNASLKTEEGKLTQSAIEKLNQFLKQYGKEKNYDIIFIANNTGTIAYANDKYDITDEILKEINRQYE
ncbi:OmpH family outer membrane protein [Pedobacter cryoconitis]|nr:OmpH family outer membrane protein [Pedobacter cryoconitis]